MPVEYLDGNLLRQLVWSGARRLEAEKGGVDALNVFPVPDGDTGTNMALTLAAACREMEQAKADSLGEVAEAVARGSLMGARGNSGVILSQLYRGFARALEGKQRVTAAEVAGALAEGVRTAYRAVMKPTEGTILTVSRDAARAALERARAGGALEAVLETAHQAAEASLQRTPDLLPVLKKAGVVDAGGQGFCLILRGWLEGLKVDRGYGQDRSPARVVEFELTEEMADIRYPYDTEFFIKGSGLPADQIRDQLARWGDSLIVVGAAELVKVHVHTDNPGRVLDYCVRQGPLTEIVIKNMREQHESLKNAARTVPPPPLPPGPVPPAKAVGIVAVASGEGLDRIFRSLGADEVVQGGQTMNPSTEEIVSAVNRIPAEQVIVLPNNKNIILAAEQVGSLTEKGVHVVPTRSVPQGVAAMLAWQPEKPAAETLGAMARAGRAVRTGEVTYAVRDSRLGEMEVRRGDVLGLLEGEMAVKGDNPEAVARDLLQGMLQAGGEFITIYYGNGVTGDQAAGLVDWLGAEYPGRQVELHDGGQPVYFYVISVE